MRIVSIVGARPQFIKAAPVCRALRQRNEEILVHSGQHYDEAMSAVFFRELGIPEPDHNLGVGSGAHGKMTGEMLVKLEELMQQLRPDVVLVYGDTNTTLAGGLAAAKLGIPVAHVEAGLRSFNRAMPEELNRVLVDHLSDVLFCPTQVAVENLEREAVTDGVELVGDVMYDAALYFSDRAPEGVPEKFGLQAGDYWFATVHRAATSDDPQKLGAVIEAFGMLPEPVLFAVHPRTAKNLETLGLKPLLEKQANVKVVPPVSYMETVALLKTARGLLTDSGGMQKEAYFFGVPCVTLRDETEWVETVELGWNVLAGTDRDTIVRAAKNARPSGQRPDVYGDGHAAERIAASLERRYA